ncbi:MAG: hypothetical protein AAF829_01035 [Pseudomonadota bacterium]
MSASPGLPNSRFNISRNDWIVVALICAGAFTIRLYAIDAASLWTDEGYSIWFARQPLGALWGEIARNEYNPILYYMILNLWMDLFGESATSVRALSAVFNCLTIPFVYLATRWAIRSPQASLIATLASVLFALAFAELQYAQEARTYTLCVLAISMTITATVRISAGLLEDPTACTDLPRWPFVLLPIGAALSVWAHYTSLIFLGVLAVYHLALLWVARDRLVELIQAYGVSAVIFAVLAARALWLMFAYALPASNHFWISIPSTADIIDAASIIFGGALAIDSWGLQILTRAVLFGPWPIIGAYVLWSRGYAIERASLILLVATSVIAFSAYLAVTYMGKPVFLQRVVLPAQIGWVILCASSLMAFRRAGFRQAAAGLLVLSFAISSISYLAGGNSATIKEPWKTVARAIATQAGPGETVYVTANGEILIGHYLQEFERTDLHLVSINGSYRTPDARPAFDSTAIRYSAPVDSALADAFEASLMAETSAWVVLRNPGSPNWDLIRPILARATPSETRFEPGPLRLYRITDSNRPGIALERDVP